MNQRALLAGLCSALFNGPAWAAPAPITVA